MARGASSEQAGPASPSENGEISHLITRIARAHWSAAAPLLGALGLYPGQELLLMRLWHTDHQTQTDLANGLRLDASTVTRTVQRLERQGLVSRAPSATDGRSMVVALTKEGRALEEPVARAWAQLEARTTTGLSERQRTETLRLLRRIEHNLLQKA
ncbi:MarR family transcriptional regulator [Kineosporia sp. J2-2]|uniref:MarR family transcriptional regulator n=1 Tax=Kineosporia corallincola TaxID=2835133 RepID=A0ABS5TRM4_9ACTN|nr:MarR family transcriptional regulator [Kineosporia corallincola]MBT0773445.1 MarR family transcriptional regulator [Kineosporia corallincola]